MYDFRWNHTFVKIAIRKYRDILLFIKKILYNMIKNISKKYEVKSNVWSNSW